MLSQLLPYLTEPTEARWLETVLSPEDGNRAYKTEVVGKRRSIADVVVRSLPSLRIPLVDLLHILPAMCLRYYTISSSSAIFPNEVHLTVAAYLFKTSEDLLVGGLTTSMLQVIPCEVKCFSQLSRAPGILAWELVQGVR